MGRCRVRVHRFAIVALGVLAVLALLASPSTAREVSCDVVFEGGETSGNCSTSFDLSEGTTGVNEEKPRAFFHSLVGIARSFNVTWDDTPDNPEDDPYWEFECRPAVGVAPPTPFLDHPHVTTTTPRDPVETACTEELNEPLGGPNEDTGRTGNELTANVTLRELGDGNACLSLGGPCVFHGGVAFTEVKDKQ